MEKKIRREEETKKERQKKERERERERGKDKDDACGGVSPHASCCYMHSTSFTKTVSSRYSNINWKFSFLIFALLFTMAEASGNGHHLTP